MFLSRTSENKKVVWNVQWVNCLGGEVSFKCSLLLTFFDPFTPYLLSDRSNCGCHWLSLDSAFFCLPFVCPLTLELALCVSVKNRFTSRKLFLTLHIKHFHSLRSLTLIKGSLLFCRKRSLPPHDSHGCQCSHAVTNSGDDCLTNAQQQQSDHQIPCVRRENWIRFFPVILFCSVGLSSLLLRSSVGKKRKKNPWSLLSSDFLSHLSVHLSLPSPAVYCRRVSTCLCGQNERMQATGRKLFLPADISFPDVERQEEGTRGKRWKSWRIRRKWTEGTRKISVHWCWWQIKRRWEEETEVKRKKEKMRRCICETNAMDARVVYLSISLTFSCGVE